MSIAVGLIKFLNVLFECIFMNHWLFSFLPTAAGEGVRFSLGGTTYQNNSLVTLEDIGEGDDALLCKTSLLACCEPFLGNWFFPNGTGLPSEIVNVTSGLQWEFYRDRGWTVVRMHRRRGGVTGIYHCEIPDTVGIIKSIYIGVYTTNTGE